MLDCVLELADVCALLQQFSFESEVFFAQLVLAFHDRHYRSDDDEVGRKNTSTINQLPPRSKACSISA